MTEVAVVGLGYVGLPLAMAFCDAGVTVRGIDTDYDKVKTLWDRKSYIDNVPSHKISKHVENGRFVVYNSTTFDIRHCDAVFICVPTKPYLF